MRDIVIGNAIIADGSGRSSYKGDIYLHEGKISRISRTENGSERNIDKSAKYIDGKGKTAAPGFIDTHCHDNYYIFHDHMVKPKLMQGVTTEVNGNCGFSSAPLNKKYFDDLKSYDEHMLKGINMPAEWESMDLFGKYIDFVDKNMPAINVADLVGHGALRIASMGLEGSKPTSKQMDCMKGHVREAMESGAFGMSTGLIYPPGCFADNNEIECLCREIAKYDGIYATHMRDEGFGVADSVRDTIDIGRKTGVRIQISHLKIATFEYERRLEAILEMIESARREGIKVGFDQYPYTTGETLISALLPPKYMMDGQESLIRTISDKSSWAEIRTEIEAADADWDNIIAESGFDYIYFGKLENTPFASGKSISETAEILGEDPFYALFEVLLENGGQGLCTMKYTDDACVETIFRSPYGMIGSDGTLTGIDEPTHPRAYQTFPKVLGEFVRKKKLLSLEETVRKMTSLPAETFGLDNKGRIEEGFDADLVLFNADTIGPDSLDDRKNHGVAYVIVGGEVLVEKGVIVNENHRAQHLKAGGR